MVIDLERLRRATESRFSDLDVGLLQSGWWNPDWAGPDLPRLLHEQIRADMRVLECGSGSTTFMLAMAARDLGVSGFSLEENHRYARLLRATLAYHDLEWRVIDAPVTRRGGCIWYSAPAVEALDLAICDGPQHVEGQMRRYGLMPHILETGATVLVDDAERDQDMLRRWAAEFDVVVERRGPLAIVRMP